MLKISLKIGVFILIAANSLSAYAKDKEGSKGMDIGASIAQRACIKAAKKETDKIGIPYSAGLETYFKNTCSCILNNPNMQVYNKQEKAAKKALQKNPDSAALQQKYLDVITNAQKVQTECTEKTNQNQGPIESPNPFSVGTYNNYAYSTCLMRVKQAQTQAGVYSAERDSHNATICECYIKNPEVLNLKGQAMIAGEMLKVLPKSADWKEKLADITTKSQENFKQCMAQ